MKKSLLFLFVLVATFMTTLNIAFAKSGSSIHLKCQLTKLTRTSDLIGSTNPSRYLDIIANLVDPNLTVVDGAKIISAWESYIAEANDMNQIVEIEEYHVGISTNFKTVIMNNANIGAEYKCDQI